MPAEGNEKALLAAGRPPVFGAGLAKRVHQRQRGGDVMGAVQDDKRLAGDDFETSRPGHRSDRRSVGRNRPRRQREQMRC